ncbi:phosphotransferase family protein [Deinococcus ruber]|nr:phosphotransferase [Deinococcus ruber]
MRHNFFDEVELLPHVRQVFGDHCQLVGVEPLKGGARKQVYVLQLAPTDQRCILYIWHDVNHYFADRDELDVTQSDDQAPRLFEVNTRFFQTLGIHVPQLYAFGVLAAGHHFALVEHLGVQNFTTFAEAATPERQAQVLQQIDTLLHRLNQCQRSYPGTLLDSTSPWDMPCHEHTLRRALLELDVVARTHARIAEHAPVIRQRLQSMAAQLEPRTAYRMIHGELGPEHILIPAGTTAPSFIDLDGAHYFDVEAEHALLTVRFGDDLYTQFLTRADLELDPARMAFYRLALYVSFVYAGSQFLASGYPDREWAEGLFDYNLKQVMAAIQIPFS